MKSVKILISLIIVAIVIFLGKSLLEKRKEEVVNAPIPQKSNIVVNTIKAEDKEIELSESFLAKVDSVKSINISTKIAGYITSIKVKEGDYVKKGDVLIFIDDNDINSNIDILKLTLNQQLNDFNLAKDIFTRNKKLYSVGGLSKELLDTSKVLMLGKEMLQKSTKEKIKQLVKQKDYLIIKAPFDGEVQNIILYGGDLAVVGKPILTMNNRIKKLIFSYTFDTKNIKVGQNIFYKNQNIGEITLIKSMANQGLAQAEIVINRDFNIPIGTNITIDVITDSARGCVVPNSSILHKKDGDFIMVYKKGKFHKYKVNTTLSSNTESILKNCPKEQIAIGAETMLSKLETYNRVGIIK